MNVDILGISELRWTGMGEFNSDGHYSYYCGQEFLRGEKKWSSYHSQQKSPKCSTWISKTTISNQCSNLKNDRMNSVLFQGKPLNIMVIQVYAQTSNTEEADVEWFCEDLQDLVELTTENDVLFIIGDWNAKVRSQEIAGV